MFFIHFSLLYLMIVCGVLCKESDEINLTANNNFSITNDLLPNMEEEPSAEVDDATEDKAQQKVNTRAQSNIIPVAHKEVQKISGLKIDEEDARIEKELAEVYKDVPDYKESGEDSITSNSTKTGSSGTVSTTQHQNDDMFTQMVINKTFNALNDFESKIHSPVRKSMIKKQGYEKSSAILKTYPMSLFSLLIMISLLF